MNVKEFLNGIKKIDLLINTKLEEVSALRDRLMNVTQSYNTERVQSSMQGDKFADTISKIVDLENDINNDIDKLVEYKSLAKELIEKLDDDILKVIVYKRYFAHCTFEQIAVEIGYSWRHTCRLHGIALQKLNKYYKDVIECHIA